MLKVFKAFIVMALVAFFMIGFHNLDLAFNMDSGCLDTALNGVVRNRSEMYRLALSQLLIAFFLMVTFFIISDCRVNKTLNFSDRNN